MKVFLPSNGMMGITSVNLREPKIQDLRQVSNLSEDSVSRMTEFLEMLMDKDDLYRITPSDRDYLFFIAASSISLNKFSYKITCECGKDFDDILNASEVSPIRLKHGEPVVVTKVINGTEYNFHRINVKQEMDIIFRALDAPDEDYDDVYKDCYVAYTLYGECTDELIKKVVQDMDVSVYYLAYFFQYFEPHGLYIVKDLKCPHCGVINKYYYKITSALINVSETDLMSIFTNLSGALSLQEFYDLSLPEYNVFVQSLNQKSKNA